MKKQTQKTHSEGVLNQSSETNQNDNSKNVQKMTRQQRRKIERQKMKEERSVKNGVKPVVLQSYGDQRNSNPYGVSVFGFYYKDDKDDGFSFVVDDSIPELLESMLNMYETVQRCFDETHHLVTVDDVLTNLQRGIHFWNDYQNCHERDPRVKYSIRIDPSNNQLIESLFFIMYGIYHLVQVGVIKDDNYNGFMLGKIHRQAA